MLPIERLRREANWLQRDLARASRTTQGQISQFERGAGLTLKTAQRIAKALSKKLQRTILVDDLIAAK